MSYVGLAIDLEDECVDICEEASSEEFSIWQQSDCLKNAGRLYGDEKVEGYYYAYDDRIQTCFSFDPRDELRIPLYQYLPVTNQTSSRKL